MHQSPDEASPKPVSQDTDRPNGKIVRLMPKQRHDPNKTADPHAPEDEDNDDPGPSAA